MAYLSSDLFTTGEAVAPTEALGFSAVQLRAISLGERSDVDRERPAAGWHARLATLLFGVSPARPLADPALEALRRFASKARFHRHALSGVDVDQLVAAGLTPGQALGLSAHLARRARG